VAQLIQTSVHAAEEFATPDTLQDVAELTQRCIEAAKDQGTTEEDLRNEVGDAADYIRETLEAANNAEADQRKGP
jgi:hypothetical protein